MKVKRLVIPINADKILSFSLVFIILTGLTFCNGQKLYEQNKIENDIMREKINEQRQEYQRTV